MPPFDRTTSYVLPQVLFRPTPSGGLQLEPASQQSTVVNRDVLPLLLLFSLPCTVEAALAAAAEEWDLEAGEFERLVGSWVTAGLLTPVPQIDEAPPTRLALFQAATRRPNGPGVPRPPQSAFALQRPVVFYPGLATREFHNPQRFPWVALIEQAFPEIRRELLALLDNRGFGRVHRPFTLTGEWSAAYLWAHGAEVEDVARLCPATAAALRQVPGVTRFGTSLFSALAPRTFLSPHCGYTNAKLRCQLPLIVPAGCRLKVGEFEVAQQEGRCIILDDSFLHSAWNPTDEDRHVLVFDFYHPDLEEIEIAYLVELAEEQKLALAYLQEAHAGARASAAAPAPAQPAAEVFATPPPVPSSAR